MVFKYFCYCSLFTNLSYHVTLYMICSIFRLPFHCMCFEYKICQILWLEKQRNLYFIRNLLVESAWWIFLGPSFFTPCTKITLQVLYKIPTYAATLWSIVLLSLWIILQNWATVSPVDITESDQNVNNPLWNLVVFKGNTPLNIFRLKKTSSSNVVLN